MRMYTSVNIEATINYGRAGEAPAEESGLCLPARVLADLYGRMISDHRKHPERRTRRGNDCRS